MATVFIRALLHPSDYWGVIHKHHLSLLSHDSEGPNTHTFTFSRPEGAHWKAGQHALFRLPGVNGKSYRPFSIASSATEGVIRIGTNVPPEPSPFKQQLIALEPGEQVTMFGPYGELYVHPGTTRIVGVAGGIGITPFRAIGYEIAHGQLDCQLDLIYAGKDDFFAYREMCDQWAEHPNLSVTYVNTPDEVNAALNGAASQHGNEAAYFISGSPGMIRALRTKLANQHITNIYSDPFNGY